MPLQLGGLFKSFVANVSDVVTDAVATGGNAVVSSATGASTGTESLFVAVTRDVVLVRPPTRGVLGTVLRRGAGFVHDGIRRHYGGYNCLLVDLTGEESELAATHEGPVACFASGSAEGGSSGGGGGRTPPPPPLQMMWSFVAAAAQHLARPNSRVLILLDEPSEGRTALCVVCFLLYTRLFADGARALRWYQAKRAGGSAAAASSGTAAGAGGDANGVAAADAAPALTPALLRYLSYFERGMSARQVFTPPPQTAVKLRVLTLRGLPARVAGRAKIFVEVEQVRAVFAGGDAYSNRARVARTVAFSSGEQGIGGRSGGGGGDDNTLQVFVGAHVEDDFCVTLSSVNDFHRRETHATLHLHASFLFATSLQNGAVLTFAGDQLATDLGPGFSVDLDVVCERRNDPTTVDDGSIVVVHSHNSSTDARAATPPPPPFPVAATATPSAAPLVLNDSSAAVAASVAAAVSPAVAPLTHGGGIRISASKLALVEDSARPASPVSMGASTIAFIPHEDLLGTFAEPSQGAAHGGPGSPRGSAGGGGGGGLCFSSAGNTPLKRISSSHDDMLAHSAVSAAGAFQPRGRMQVGGGGVGGVPGSPTGSRRGGGRKKRLQPCASYASLPQQNSQLFQSCLSHATTLEST